MGFKGVRGRYLNRRDYKRFYKRFIRGFLITYYKTIVFSLICVKDSAISAGQFLSIAED